MQFSTTGKLELPESYFKQYKKINVKCGYGLTEGALAHFLDAALKQDIEICFVYSSIEKIPAVLLNNVTKKAEAKQSAAPAHKNMTCQLHEDVEFSTGIGKTYFLENVLPKQEDKQGSKVRTCFNSFQEWLEAKSEDKEAVLILDEASFKSELKGQGKHFLKRLTGLRHDPPTVG